MSTSIPTFCSIAVASYITGWPPRELRAALAACEVPGRRGPRNWRVLSAWVRSNIRVGFVP